jgi:hypothetical protein
MGGNPLGTPAGRSLKRTGGRLDANRPCDTVVLRNEITTRPVQEERRPGDDFFP